MNNEEFRVKRREKTELIDAIKFVSHIQLHGTQEVEK